MLIQLLYLQPYEYALANLLDWLITSIVPFFLPLKVVLPHLLQKMALGMVLLNKLYANLLLRHKTVSRHPFATLEIGKFDSNDGFLQLLHASLGKSLLEPLHHLLH